MFNVILCQHFNNIKNLKSANLENKKNNYFCFYLVQNKIRKIMYLFKWVDSRYINFKNCSVIIENIFDTSYRFYTCCQR